MFCPTCGKPIPDDVSFCPQCGAAVRRAESAPNQAADGPNAPGTPSATPDPATSQQAVPTPGVPVPPPRRGIPKAAVIGIAAVALVAIVAAVAAFALPGLFGPRDFVGTISVSAPGERGAIECTVNDDGTAEILLSDVYSGMSYGSMTDMSIVGSLERVGDRSGAGEYTFSAETVEAGGVTVNLSSLSSMYAGLLDAEQADQLERMLDSLEVTVLIPEGAATGGLTGTWGVDFTDCIRSIARVSGQSLPESSYEATVTVDGDGTYQIDATWVDTGDALGHTASGTWQDDGAGSYSVDVQGQELLIEIDPA